MSDDRRSKVDVRGAEDRFDTAIDRAVREMLDVEQPRGFRARVLRQIEAGDGSSGGVASASSWKVLWVAMPVAAAAILILAVLSLWRANAPAPTPSAPQQIVRSEPPAIMPPVGPPVTAVQPEAPTPRFAARRAPRAAAAPGGVIERMAVTAAAAVTDEDTNFTAIAALEGPPSIAVGRLAGPQPPGLHSIEPAPMLVPALEVTALPETPRARREE
jgi:hypothetical protein